MPLIFHKKPALVVYVTCGDPDLATTREIVLAAIEAGADVIELGVPFMGLEKFCKVTRHAGLDGALLTDLPVEEAGQYLREMRQADLATIFLAAPTSTDERLKRVAEASTGFVYAVSRTGVTGARQQLAGEAKTLVRRLRKYTKLPVAVGFGVSTAEQFAEVGEFADAAVVGSAIVETIERNRGREAAAVGEFVGKLTADQ